MKARHLLIMTLLVLGLPLVACGVAEQPSSEATSPATRGESPVPQTDVSPVSPIAPDAQPDSEIEEAAVSYLADELDISPQAIDLLEVEAVEWSDASLGCPKEGQMYAQVVTPGYRMLLEAEGETYELHTDRSGDRIVICEPER